MRLAIGGGGTAGHVYPALATLESWPEPKPDILWVGSSDGMERGIVTARGLEFVGIAAGALRGKAPQLVLANAAKLGAGFGQALAALRRFGPDVLLTTGGYVSVPVATAAALLRIPVVVFLPDVKPGFAVRAQTRIATRIAASFDEALRWLPRDKTVVTGYPVRPALLAAEHADARRRLGLADDLPVLLLYGGSRGAQTLNDGVASALPALLERCQFVHVAGTVDHARMQQRAASLDAGLAERYHLHDYLGDGLVDAMAAADLCVARAGASTLAELPAVGLPGIVVPGLFSDQELNADYLVARGAAISLTNADVQAGKLPQAILRLLEDPHERARMAAASRTLARPQAAAALRELVAEATV